MKNKTINFFELLSERLYQENNLSDITWALLNISSLFRKFFIEFFFDNKKVINNINEIVETSVIYREYSVNDSRPDFYIESAKQSFIVEVKKYDNDYHFQKYYKNFKDSGKALISINKLTSSNQVNGKNSGFTMKTWSEFYFELENKKESINDIEQSLIEGYLQYLKKSCYIINYKKMKLESLNSLYLFNNKIKEIIERNECEVYSKAKSFDENFSGWFFKIKIKSAIIYPWFGITYNDEEINILVELRAGDNWCGDIKKFNDIKDNDSFELINNGDTISFFMPKKIFANILKQDKNDQIKTLEDFFSEIKKELKKR